MLKKIFFIVLILIFSNSAVAQLINYDSENIDLKTGVWFLTNLNGFNEELPYWSHVNQDGRIDQYSANALNYIEWKAKLYDNSVFDLNIGGSLTSRVSESSTVFFDQAYVDLKISNFRIMGGRYIDPLALKEDELSTGSFMYSRNAIPIPKVAFATDGFVGVPGTNGIVRYNGLFAHGWFDNDRHVKDAYLHEKYFYLSIKYAFFDVRGGIVHNVQWGGVSDSRGELPSGGQTFWEVITATGSSDENAPGGEQSNAVGNSIAAYEFSLGLSFDDFDLNAYRLFYLEDKVSTRFRSPWDGIWGLSVKPKDSKLIQNFIWEHINTKRMDSYDWEPRGTASYYNNGIYRTGWTYQGRVIGNPMLLTDGTNERPIYNNIIIAHHLGVSGQLSKMINYKMLYTFSRNYGEVQDQIITRLPREECPGTGGRVCAELRPLEELKKVNHSLMFAINSFVAGYERLKYGIAVTADMGELYGDRIGAGINLEYELIK
jgi:hypothetical protein